MTGPALRCAATSTGTLSSSPPSTNNSPPMTTGGTMPGTALLARSHSASGPREGTSTPPRPRLQATQA